jgi:hypothetical protein
MTNARALVQRGKCGSLGLARMFDLLIYDNAMIRAPDVDPAPPSPPARRGARPGALYGRAALVL